MKYFKKKFALAIIFAFIATGITILTYHFNLTETLELETLDLRIKHFQKQPNANKDIVVILIDEHSLQSLKSLVGRWPWPRSLYKDLIDFLTLCEAKAIIFDILFTEPQVPRDNEGKLGPDDLLLAEGTLSSGKVIHALQLLNDKEDESHNVILDKELPLNIGGTYALKNFKTDAPDNDNNNVFYLPLEELSQNAAGLGVVEFQSDADGVYRHTNLIRSYHGKYFPVLSLAGLILTNKNHVISVDKQQIYFGERKIPLQQNGKYLVNMKKDFITYSISGIFASYQKIQNGEMTDLIVPPQELKDKIVFIGASAVGVEDLKMTSTGRNVPGVLLHASIASNILDNDFIKKTDTNIIYLLTLISTVLIACSILLFNSHLVSNLITLTIFSAYSFLAYYLFYHYNLWLIIVSPFIGILTSYVISYVYLSATEGREKRKTRKMLAQYVSPHVLAEVMDKRDNVLTAEVGAKEELTILFSDVRGFTTLSENSSPELVVETLNYYLERMVEIVFEYDGTLDKFIGDAVMAFWGAPLILKDHARRGVLASLQMREKLKEINQYFKTKGYPQYNIGVGLNTGPVILGNIGSDKKLDYTVIGDNVNLASRVEGLTKTYHSDILITETTFKQIGDDIPCRIIDLVKVKGKNKPIAIYAPLAMPADMGIQSIGTERAIRLCRLSSEAFDAYMNKNWDTAIKLFNQIISDYKTDPVSEMFIARCTEYKTHTPEAPWDGSHTMKTK